MVFIDPIWTDAGRADAQRNDIGMSEAVGVVYAATTLQVYIGDGPDRLLCLGGRIGRVIVVALDRQFRHVTLYGITEVRHATEREARAWERRQP